MTFEQRAFWEGALFAFDTRAQRDIGFSSENNRAQGL
jgi:hypothetical protein